MQSFPSCKGTHLFGILSLVKFNKGILQRVPRLLVPYHLATHDRPEPREDELQVFIPCDRVQLAHKQHVLWWPDIRKRQVTDHLQRQRSGSGCLFPPFCLRLFFRQCRQRVFIFRDTSRIVWRPSWY